MKKAMLALAATSVIALSACGTSSSDKIVTSKAGDITKEEFYDQMKTQAGKQVLNNMVMEKVLIKNYKVEDKDVDKKFDEMKKQYGDQFDTLLKQQGIKEETIKTGVRAQLAQEKAIEKTITDKELKENYKPEIKASHILVKDEATAKKVKEELGQGKSFEELAKQYSEDTGSKEKGGDLGYFTAGKMVKEFEDAAYKLKKDEVSEPVKSQFGYHIIKVTDIKEQKPFDEVKGDIKKDLVQKKAQDAAFMNDLMMKEIKKADVKVDDKDLKDLFEEKKADDKKEEKK
ncbi:MULTISPECIES: peptidylprolyl isomerase PrsA [Bacillus]|jgi:foldase protein PrsA|uniref:Foldase protein PrsA 1 n=7 Tax=Bacillus cereus group TaxID=86661 RepID=PRSA1_BACCR|nr:MULTISPECIES: peptidylprolyl isomerase PrsA [Bacillus]Q81GY5.1 RecName: Full=Foldase protein PrsA 1; Flags: Precursor [Bacillus cereus ATCC 14579]MBR3338377.1 peptidylprolyl isomerase PrsA [Bacillus sp. (in: firmicutes)]CEY11619.1 peptidyl-prolyl cis-trans isomerase [Streptococcus pneumoniae]AAP08030.1 Protein export protein prsA precursor [Bacillus cereus ATCC 14579]ACK61938.1 peptidylprolyl isomerase PrsA1 [Bacillus cereus B4264]ADH05738.1 peptidylprolyl isomerase [Bacillus thuringiensis